MAKLSISWSKKKRPSNDSSTNLNDNFTPSNTQDTPSDSSKTPNFPNLNKYGRNLTQLARENKLQPVIGRDEQIRRIIKILSRKNKNNPVLVGEPGVGKTAIVEGMAFKIVQNQVPEDLQKKQLFELNLTSLTAGASVQGEFEKRIQDILREVSKYKDHVIIFIDEIHLLMKSGGSMDLANILKPIMARGELKFIGATTHKEYKIIEKDSAFERRILKVRVDEPSIKDTITILRGLKTRFESFHHVKILDDAIIAAVKFSKKYITDRFLPDKAIDLIDESGANVKVEMNYTPEQLEKINNELGYLKVELQSYESENKVEEITRVSTQIKDLEKKRDLEITLWDEIKSHVYEVAECQKELDDKINEKGVAEGEGDYERASRIQYQEIPQLRAKLKKLQEENKSSGNIVDELQIAKVVAKFTSIPVDKLMETSNERFKNLKEKLQEGVKGQQRAIDLVQKTMIRYKAGIADPNRPIGSFLFMGPTGVGKTELAKVMTLNLFDNVKDQFIRLDMSEYSEPHSVSKLYGSPPGYVGYEEGGQLTEKVRLNPYSLILFDEIEKAHPKILTTLLQILDDGHIKDGQGKFISFKNTLIILTTNIGSDEILSANNPEELDRKRLQEILSQTQHFKPELINRLDEIVPFTKLDKESIKQIVLLELNKLNDRIKEKKYRIQFDESVVEWLSSNGYDVKYGARPIKRFIKSEVEFWIANEIIKGEIQPKTKITILWDEKDQKMVAGKIQPLQLDDEFSDEVDEAQLLEKNDEEIN